VPAKNAPDHFEKLLEGPCPNHALRVKHLYKDCALMKRFLSGGFDKGNQRKKLEPAADDAKGKDGGFSALDGCLMIFGGTATYDPKRRQKIACHEVYAAELAMSSFFRWSESAITFDQTDYSKASHS